MFKAIKNLFDFSEKEIRRYRKIVEEINSHEKDVKKLSDDQLQKLTGQFKSKIKKGDSLESLLPETFAVVREVSVRVLGLRHYDVQMMAAITLFEGKIAEQKTGEGKTLAATPALYLRALAGKGTHLVTVNDYLARRDSGWMAPIFDFLGLSVGCIIPYQQFIYDPKHLAPTEDKRLTHLKVCERKQAYEADVTYGTSNEFGFDYLRDNMVQNFAQMVQRSHYFAIVDEVDFALIDEARTPLIISSPTSEPTKKYYKFFELAETLAPDTDYTIDEKSRSAMLTEYGIRKIERALGSSNLYEEDFETIHHIENALKARTLFVKDKDYVVKDGQVVIVDEFTGRMMQGRRWSDGLHQAVEAKEGVNIQQESKTWATVTFQNYFRMYQKLGGMTGTAQTEAEEFKKIYELDVISIPTNKPILRVDNPDLIYKTQRSKYAAVAVEIEECYKKGQPVLIGTTSIENNEIISSLLKRKGVPHQILNAKNHQKEAAIIAKAGKKKSITVATNMAGRGVDIILGGQPPESTKENKEAISRWKQDQKEILSLGGLHVVGTERHESRRIDNQLRGRGGRQGDPGSSRFFVALDDNLMRVFGGEQISSLMTRFNMPENVPLSHSMVNRVIEQIQVKVEGFNFDIRKSLVEYDDIVDKQRGIIYKRRNRILKTITNSPKKLSGEVLEILKKEIELVVAISIDPITAKPDIEKVVMGFCEIVPIDDKSGRQEIRKKVEKSAEDKISETLYKIVETGFKNRENVLGESVCRDIEKSVYLYTLDNLWVDHLTALDDLKEGVRLRGYGQRDPLVEYRKESFVIFQKLLTDIDYHLARRIFRVKLENKPESEIGKGVETKGQVNIPGVQSENSSADDAPTDIKVKPVISGGKKVGRNDPCWCGSGKKWKKCHYPETG